MFKSAVFVIILLLSSCNSYKKMPVQQSVPIQTLHDIWALNAIGEKELNKEEFSGGKRIPMLEIYIEDKIIRGNDSCNDLFGKIENLDQTSIKFGGIGGTKMMCPEMKLSSDFVKSLIQTKTYKIAKMYLYFYDKNGIEILKFIKVD